MKIPALVLCGLLLGTLTSSADDIAKLVAGNLVGMQGQKPVDDATLTPIKYYAIYYSAAWCPPCHRFTPKLVDFYNGFKTAHPNFELIFVSEDKDADAMLGYMKEMSMPWLAVRFDALKHDGSGTFKGSGIESYAGDGIPDLVLVDASGKVLSDSYDNGQYVGPEKVMTDIPTLVK